MDKALPSAAHPVASHEHPIASQTAASSAAAKGKLHKRPEDEVLADPNAVPATDDQMLVAQAAPAAAEGAAGGGAAAAAAEGSASTGAGLPAVAAAAAGGGGIGGSTIAAGAAVGGVGLAAAGGGGGGGGGGAAVAAPVAAPTPITAAPPAVTPPTTVTPPVVTPPPPPPPPPAGPAQIHNFGEYLNEITNGGATAATNASVAAGTPVSVDISGGFARSVLPQTLSDLRPSMVYNVANASVGTINDGGISVDLQGNQDSFVTAHSDAAAGASNVMWMQSMAVMNFTGHNPTLAAASATADGAGSDAEIGIQHFSMDSTGTADINGKGSLVATATGGASARTFVGDVTMSVDSSATGTSTAPVSSYIHMGDGEAVEPGILASASGAGSTAGTAVAGDVSLTGHGDDIYVYNSGIAAEGLNGGAAATAIGGNVSFLSEGREAHSYVLVDASTDGAAGSQAGVVILGDVDLQSTGSALALTRAAVHADGAGSMVDIEGHLNVDSSAAPSANSFMQVTSQGGDANVSIDSLGMNVEGAGHGWMDLYTDHSGGLDIGSVNLSATAGSDVTIHVQDANDALTGIVDPTFLAHGDGTASVSIDTLNVGGAGEVHAFLNSQTFGTINEASSLNRLDLHYQLADQGHAGIGGTDPVSVTTLNGFTPSHTEIIYNGVIADGTNFSDAGSFSSLADLNTGLNTALDGTHKYVFAVYNGAGDISGDGVADTGSGVLAWDDNGAGITSVLMLPGTTHLTPTDIA